MKKKSVFWNSLMTRKNWLVLGIAPYAILALVLSSIIGVDKIKDVFKKQKEESAEPEIVESEW